VSGACWHLLLNVSVSWKLQAGILVKELVTHTDRCVQVCVHDMTRYGEDRGMKGSSLTLLSSTNDRDGNEDSYS
jgi:hypothetical protein